MTDREQEIEEVCQHNWEDYMEHGPGLRYTQKQWVKARDSETGYVLLGGFSLGGLGTMWFEECLNHRKYPGYDGAPDWPGASRGAFGGPLRYLLRPVPEECPGCGVLHTDGWITRKLDNPIELSETYMRYIGLCVKCGTFAWSDQPHPEWEDEPAEGQSGDGGAEDD